MMDEYLQASYLQYFFCRLQANIRFSTPSQSEFGFLREGVNVKTVAQLLYHSYSMVDVGQRESSQHEHQNI